MKFLRSTCGVYMCVYALLMEIKLPEVVYGKIVNIVQYNNFWAAFLLFIHVF